MRTSACPSCGAPVRFRGASTTVAVCGFCKATLVREGAKLEDIGRQAELLEDHSPLRIGADGRYKGQGFTVVGRIQYRYGAGVWNEWHVIMGNGGSAWLSDANRQYTISFLRPPQDVPPFGQLRPGQKLHIENDEYTVMNLEQAEVVAGEGELPFRFESGWKADVADLRGPGNRFATIDYSEDKPFLYVGEKLPFDAFSFSGLRDPDQVLFTKGTALSFKCGGCGAPVEKHLPTTACGFCGTVSDVTKGHGELVQKNELNLEAVKPTLPLGASGTFRGIAYEIVGFLRRAIVVDGTTYEWLEYLLHNNEQGYAWITEYDGHFNYVKDAAEVPKKISGLSGKMRVRYLGRTFTHFQHAEAKVSALAGEFYWRVKLGDRAVTDDYISPPLMLSSEQTGNELTWSLGEYVGGEEVWKAFKLKERPPAPIGIAPNQPSPHTGQAGRYWKLFGLLLLVAFVMQLAFQLFNFAVDPSARVPYAVTMGQVSRHTSPVFKVGGVLPQPITLKLDSNTQRSWVILNLQLVEADTGRAYGVRRQLGFTRVGGADDFTPTDVVEIPNVEPGRYTLAIDATAGPPPGNDWPGEIRGNVEVVNAPVDWANFWLLAIFLLAWPIAATWRTISFETKRWAESDCGHALQSTSGSDDDE
jgi:uncharacterized Zn finger protein (UPF0148 family)